MVSQPAATTSGRLVRLFRLLDDGIDRVERWILGGGILAMSALSIANVFARNLLGNSLTFVDEINQILIILITFLGVGYAARQGRHIRMTALYDQLPAAGRKALMVLIAASTAALLFALSWYALDYVLQTRAVGSVSAALRIPLYLIYAVVPLGLALGGVQYLLAALRNLLSPGVYVSFRREDRYDEGTEGHI